MSTLLRTLGRFACFEIIRSFKSSCKGSFEGFLEVYPVGVSWAFGAFFGFLWEALSTRVSAGFFYECLFKGFQVSTSDMIFRGLFWVC